MKKFFSDKGTNDVPDEYLIAVEMGLRSFGSDRYAFGTFAMLQTLQAVTQAKPRDLRCYLVLLL